MKWENTVDFREMMGKTREELRVAAARVCVEAGKETQKRALEGFTTFGIRLITGRSRSLYALQPGEGMFEPGAGKVSYEVGYVNWPKSDSHGTDIPFYPWYLNYGTSKMAARPFHTAAVEAVRPIFNRKIEEAFVAVLQGKKFTWSAGQ